MEEKQFPPTKIPESEEEQEKVIKLLEERLEKHDNNRKAVQDKLTEILNKLRAQIGELEERINRELCENFVSEEDRLQAVLNELRENSTIGALQEDKRRLSVVQSYDIIENKEPNNNDLTTLYELKTERRIVPEDDSVGLAILKMNSSTHDPSNATEMSEITRDSAKFTEERERLVKLLEERLQTHDNSKKAVQNKLQEICERLRAQIDSLEDKINKELEGKFTSEDNRLQAALNELRGNRTASALQKAKAELLVEQSYEIIENKEVKHDLTTLYELKAEKRIIPELMAMGKPSNVRVTGVDRGRRVYVQFTYLNPDEERVLSDNTIVNTARYRCLFFRKDNEQESKEYFLGKNDEDNNSSFLFTPDILEAETTYGIRVKMVVEDRESEWSGVAEFTTPEFKECCVWKKCLDDVDNKMKYSVDEKNPRIATKTGGNWCTIIGNTYIPLNKVTSWSINVLKSEGNNGYAIFIGIAPNDINQNDKYNCGWYFYCFSSTLYSGPPHNYNYPGKPYGPRKEGGQYVHTGESVGVAMDTTKGDLSFVLNGVNLGVAYEGIPLDKPLVPCVILYHKGDSVELDTSEVKENEVVSSVPVPSNIIAKSIMWDSITLMWDEVADATFYQVEVDGSKSWDATTTNTFTKRGLLPEAEHSFRVRTVRGSSVSEWSGVVKGRTLKALEFSECVWKKCPGYVYDGKKYSIDERNPRVATKVNDLISFCTIIGSTHIPLNKVIQWNIKILKSKNNGDRIYIGIAPFDINQNDYNYNNCGWYFYCFCSALFSGPPHKYSAKAYGPRKKENGQYVHTGDSVCVVVDTTKGELSFVLNGVNLGVAYEGIPLDKPLVPCVLLYRQGDSVELIV